MAKLIGIGISHIDNQYQRVKEILEEERPDGILLENHIISFNNNGEIINALENEPEEKRKISFLEQKLRVNYEKYVRDTELVRKSKKSEMWTFIEEEGFFYKNFWRLFGAERRLFRDVPAVRVKIGDFVYYDGALSEQNAGIDYALNQQIPWYAIDIPLVAPLGNLSFLRFNEAEYSIVPCPIGEDELQRLSLNNISRVWLKYGRDGGLSLQESEQIRNTYAARAAERISELFGHRKLAAIYGNRHFSQASLLQQSQNGQPLPKTILELTSLDTSYRNASE